MPANTAMSGRACSAVNHTCFTDTRTATLQPASGSCQAASTT